MGPVIAAATPSGARVQYPRLIRKPRTPPPSRRATPSSAPPIVELPPAVEEMNGGMCTEDKISEEASPSGGGMQEGAPRASFEILVNRVVNEVSRRVLEHIAPAPYMVGLSECVAHVRYLLKCSSHDGERTRVEADKQNKHDLKLTLINKNLRTHMCDDRGMTDMATVPPAKATKSGFKTLQVGLHSAVFSEGVDDHNDVKVKLKMNKNPKHNANQDGCTGVVVDNEACNGGKQIDNDCTRDSECGKHPRIVEDAACADGVNDACKSCRLHFWGFGLFGVLKGFFSSGVARLECRKAIRQDKQAKTSPAKSKLPKNGDIAYLRSGDRQQQDASASMRMPTTQCFDAHGRFHCWVMRVCCMLSLLLDGMLDSNIWVLRGGMLNQIVNERIESDRHAQQISFALTALSLEECAQNLLIGDCVNLENIRTLLDHPEAPWIQKNNGFQITLGAARLTITKASTALPNFTKVITSYMQQCNKSAYGSTIVINKNLATDVHIDSRNEKLPAYLTAITDFSDGEIFLKSEYGDKFYKEHKGFLVHIPIGSTLAIPTFKIPHATNTWNGNRIIMVLFTSPIKRIDASKHNLRSKLQQLGFQIPGIDKSWVDCSIVGNSNGSPIYSRPTSIRGYFSAEEPRCNVADNRDEFGFGISDCDICDVSSECACEYSPQPTSTWPDPFESQLSDIEYCSDSMTSPATTEIDTDSESQQFASQDRTQKYNVGRKRKCISPLQSASHNQDRVQSGHRRSNADFAILPVPLRDDGSPLRLSLEGCGDDSDFRPRCTLESDSNDCQNENRTTDQFGFNNSRTVNWSLQSDPIEDCTDVDMSSVLHGGGAPAAEFQPNKADISKLVQKLKNVQHGFAPKQIRMLLISDAKFFKKIERTTDTKQLQNCVAAAAQRMGLNGAPELHKNSAMSSDVISNRQKSDTQTSSAVDGKASPGKGGLTAAQKGKGRGDIQNIEPKGRGKGKNAQDANVQKQFVEHITVKSKDKGKGKGSNITYSIDPDGWNVRPLTEFANTHGGIYMCEKEEQAKRIAEKGVGKNYPIGILAPFPMDIGVKQPESIYVEFVKHIGDQNQKISMQAFLHQITYVDVEYRKMAPAVSIQKPSIAKTSVRYLTFSDSGACTQTRVEIEQKRIPAVKQWISSLVQHNRGLEILDVWNVQAVHQHANERVYQASVRVPSTQVESLLAMSSPGKLQVNVPGVFKDQFAAHMAEKGRSTHD